MTFSQKYPSVSSSTPRPEGGEATGFELFAGFSLEADRDYSGDVTRPVVNYGMEYAKMYAVFVGRWGWGNEDLPVENRNFSTISTGFSTGAFAVEMCGDIHF